MEKIAIATNNLQTIFTEGAVTKKAIADMAGREASVILDGGEQNPLDTLLFIRASKEYLNKLEEGIKPAAIKEIAAYSKSDNNKYGITFENVFGASTYDYSEDDEWVELNEDVEVAAKKRKAREDLMKIALRVGAYASEESGEIIRPPITKSGGKETAKITIKSK